MNNIIKRVWNQNRLVNIEDLTGMVFQAEADGHTFEISGVDDDGNPVALSGTVSGVFMRPDNTDVVLTGSASDGVASVTLDEDCYAIPGRFGLTIFVTSDDQTMAVYACVGTVSRTSTGNVAGDTPASVEDLVNAINAAIADLNSAIGQIPASYANVMAAIAPPYSASSLYSVGSYVWYDGAMYRCTTAIGTAEAWNSAHWTAAVVGNDLFDLKSDFAALSNNTVMEFAFTSGTGHSSNADPVKVNIPQGQPFYLKSDQALPYLSVYAWYADGTKASVLSSSNKSFETCLVAQNDIVAFSVYFSSPSSSGTFSMLVSYGLRRELVDLEKRSEEVGTVREKTFSYPSGSVHSSNKDMLFINIRNGEKYLLSIDSSITGPIEVLEWYGNNQYISKGNITNKASKFFTASQDTFAVGIYFASQSMPGVASFTIRTGSEIDLYKLQSRSDKVIHRLPYAQHVPGNTRKTLTLLHVSDIHAESSVLENILADAAGLNYDDSICTGDMVGGTYAQISSWWPPAMLTCIGNHDTASYSSQTGYNWTALSMADRDAYYIAPFESDWGIVHTSGTSYYYKDYTDQKVRLIVMDAMLYNDNGAEATAQTSWLANLLTGAISNSLHVLIAIHAPHGGAKAKACSFTRYNQTDMPTNADCNTPQAVVDAVASAITNGLHFIGYIVGHTHQDNIWDAENDGSQLMYCITCAALTEAQWKNSDQYRDLNNNAYNLVTVDTANTLVKIIRGGGADLDDHMRTREAICFNYSTGEIVGESL